VKEMFVDIGEQGIKRFDGSIRMERRRKEALKQVGKFVVNRGKKADVLKGRIKAVESGKRKINVVCGDMFKHV